jgi:hypothetical protein
MANDSSQACQQPAPSKFAETMASSSKFESLKACITKKDLHTKIKKAFEAKTRIAVFVEYEVTCRGNEEVSEKLRELNRYHNVNVALIMNGCYNDLDKEAKKLLILDETAKKRRDRNCIIKYPDGNSLKTEMISVIKEWYKDHTVFVLVFCGHRLSGYYHEIDNLRDRTEVRTISSSIWDGKADSPFTTKRIVNSNYTVMIINIIEFLISLSCNK